MERSFVKLCYGKHEECNNALAWLYVLKNSVLFRVGVDDELEAFVDKSTMFAERYKWMTSKDVDPIMEELFASCAVYRAKWSL